MMRLLVAAMLTGLLLSGCHTPRQTAQTTWSPLPPGEKQPVYADDEFETGFLAKDGSVKLAPKEPPPTEGGSWKERHPYLAGAATVGVTAALIVLAVGIGAVYTWANDQTQKQKSVPGAIF